MRPPLYDFQKKAVKFIHYHRACYLALEMGLGKTRICLEVSRTLDEPMFIVAPKFAALSTWPDEFRKWFPHEKFVVVHGKDKEKIWANSDKYTNIIMSYSTLPWFSKIVEKRLRPLQKFFFVFDEASMVKNWQSSRWLILNNMKPIMSQYRVALSGTPTPQSLQDLWSQYNLLDNGKSLGRDFYGFRNRFFDYNPERYQTTIKPFSDTKIAELISPITLRLKAADYLDLPKVVYNNIKVTMPPGLRKKYDYLMDEFMLEFPSSTVMANSTAVVEHKLRQFLQGAIYSTSNEQAGSLHRLPSVTQYLHDIKAQVVKQIVETSSGHPILVATQFKFEQDILNKVMGYQVPSIDGRTSGPLGKRLIQEWNNGRLPLLRAHPRSLAYGLNLQTGGNIIIFMALPWELDLYQQLIARLVRQGQKADRVIITTIGFRNTIDDKVATYLRRKNATQEGLFNAVTTK